MSLESSPDRGQAAGVGQATPGLADAANSPMNETMRAPHAALCAVQRADLSLRMQYARLGSPSLDAVNWDDYDALIEAIDAGIGNRPSMHRFTYQHPEHLQDPDEGARKPYPVSLAYFDSGGDGEPVIAVGGIINVSQRFDFLALDAAATLRVIALDLAGRGRSGWLAEQSECRLESYMEQLIQLLNFLDLDTCTLLGSSLGGSVAIALAARHPGRVRRIVLNDSGPYIPVERRRRRAQAVGRHYVFRSPSEMFRRAKAAARHSGPAPDAVLLHAAHHQTRWSDDEEGRVYRRDLRALLAYRADARSSLDLWEDWAKVKCPVLLIHGTRSDATTQETIDRMRGSRSLSVIHVPGTGHTPSLSNYALIANVVRWIGDDRPFDADHALPTDGWPRRVLIPDDLEGS